MKGFIESRSQFQAIAGKKIEEMFEGVVFFFSFAELTKSNLISLW